MPAPASRGAARFCTSALLLPPPPEPGVGLPERSGALVVGAVPVGGVVEVSACRLDELVFRCARADALDPGVELLPQLSQVVLDVLEEPEVDQRESPRPTLVDG